MRTWDRDRKAYVNGKIVTVDQNNAVVEAMLVEDGRILATGTTKEILSVAPAGTETVDLAGRTVVPGIVDSHCHAELAITNLENGLSIQCPPIASLTVVLAMIEEKAKTLAPCQWLIVRGPNAMASKLEDKRLPTIEELDRVTPNNPAVLFAAPHYSVLNTLAVEETGYWHETLLPKYASMGRDPKTGLATGLYTELWDMLNMIPWDDATVERSLRDGQVPYFVRHGITSIHEYCYSNRGMRMWQKLRRENELSMRMRFFVQCPQVCNLDDVIALQFGRGFGDEWLSFGGVKIFVDGVMGHANGFPYDDVKWTPKELNETILKAHNAGYQIIMHALTPTGIRMAADALENALAQSPRADHRHRIEHSADRWLRSINGKPYISDETKDKFRKNHILSVPTPQFIYAFPDRAGVPMRTMMREGFIIPGASDTTGTQPESSNPWHSIWCLVARKNLYGQVLAPDERLTPMEALRVFTGWGAYGAFEENIKGSIEPGKLADFSILDRDFLTVEEDDIRNVRSDATIVGGKVRYSSGKFFA